MPSDHRERGLRELQELRQELKESYAARCPLSHQVEGVKVDEHPSAPSQTTAQPSQLQTTLAAGTSDLTTGHHAKLSSRMQVCPKLGGDGGNRILLGSDTPCETSIACWVLRFTGRRF